MKVKEIKPGFEKEVELLLAKKEAIASEKELAIEEALRKVDEQFIEREETIISILNLVTVEVEVPEVDETSEEFSEDPESQGEVNPVESSIEANPASSVNDESANSIGVLKFS